MASISSSSTYNDPGYLANLCMPLSDKSSLSWKEIEMNREKFQQNPGRIREVLFQFKLGERRIIELPLRYSDIKTSEFTLISLQTLYKKISLETRNSDGLNKTKLELEKIIPSRICVYRAAPTIYDRNKRIHLPHFEEPMTQELGSASYVGYDMSPNQDNEAESLVFGLQRDNARETIQLADQLLVSLLRQEERGIAYYNFSDITGRLKSLVQKATNTNVQEITSTNEIGTPKTRIISRLNFLFHSLQFIQTHLFPGQDQLDNDLRGRITIVLETLPTSLIDIIVEYGSGFKIINSKTSSHSSSSNNTLLS